MAVEVKWAVEKNAKRSIYSDATGNSDFEL